MKTQSELKLVDNNGYKHIILYFKYQNQMLRIPTHNKYIKSYIQKDLYFNSGMDDYKKLNDRTKELKSRVDEYIKRQLAEPFPHFSQKRCIEFIDEKHYHKSYDGTFLRLTDFIQRDEPPKEPKTVLQYFNEFLELKKKELLNHYNSYKKYITLENLLKDYHSNKKPLTFDTMNSELFMYSFRDYLIVNKEYNDNSANMKLKNLKTFLRWIEDQNIHHFDPKTFKVNVSTYENNVITLNKEEIKQLIELKLENPFWKKIIDLFVLNCFLGLRHSDLYTLNDKDFVKDQDGDMLLVKDTIKTDEKIIVPVFEPALSILKKYDFNAPKFTNQYFNRELRKILRHYKLFPEKVKIKRKVNGQDKGEYKEKRDLITSHTCRKSFVTMAVNSKVPINAIMLATGHKKLATIQAYVHKETDKNKFRAIEL
jgi:integrase